MSPLKFTKANPYHCVGNRALGMRWKTGPVLGSWGRLRPIAPFRNLVSSLLASRGRGVWRVSTSPDDKLTKTFTSFWNDWRAGRLPYANIADLTVDLQAGHL